ncbi:unnamed protein product [Mytilus coruscus]|uniref:Uncharacterized protein n=1 Tax=Mytilus coruscus TaxID=42192 RepID=A0A6J8D7V7_MYTCO|nr:unnamed protein product [Mytilus coruscus]
MYKKNEEKPENVDEKEEESKKKSEEKSENVEEREKESKKKLKNQKMQERKAIETENTERKEVENANEVGETIGNSNPSKIESHTCIENDSNWKDVPDPSKCVGKYVVIKHDEKPYPGVVEDAGESDIYVQCMHRVGKKDNNCFFWPRTIKDKCWYEYDDVLAVIPEPTKIEGSYSHYQIDQQEI